MQNATPALDSLENKWTAFMDLHEALARPLKADERRSFGWLLDLYDSQPVAMELQHLDDERHDYYDRLSRQMLAILDRDPPVQIAPRRDMDCVEGTTKRAGWSVLQGVKLGFETPPDVVLRSVDLLNDFLREADTLIRQLKDSYHVLGDASWTDFESRVLEKRQALKLAKRIPRIRREMLAKRKATAAPASKPKRNRRKEKKKRYDAAYAPLFGMCG